MYKRKRRLALSFFPRLIFANVLKQTVNVLIHRYFASRFGIGVIGRLPESGRMDFGDNQIKRNGIADVYAVYQIVYEE